MPVPLPYTYQRSQINRLSLWDGGIVPPQIRQYPPDLYRSGQGRVGAMEGPMDGIDFDSFGRLGAKGPGRKAGRTIRGMGAYPTDLGGVDAFTSLGAVDAFTSLSGFPDEPNMGMAMPVGYIRSMNLAGLPDFGFGVDPYVRMPWWLWAVGAYMLLK